MPSGRPDTFDILERFLASLISLSISSNRFRIDFEKVSDDDDEMEDLLNSSYIMTLRQREISKPAPPRLSLRANTPHERG